MNIGAWILFGNAIFTTVLSSAIVIWILRKEYLPVIKQLDSENESSTDLNDEWTKEG